VQAKGPKRLLSFLYFRFITFMFSCLYLKFIVSLIFITGRILHGAIRKVVQSSGALHWQSNLRGSIGFLRTFFLSVCFISSRLIVKTQKSSLALSERSFNLLVHCIGKVISEAPEDLVGAIIVMHNTKKLCKLSIANMREYMTVFFYIFLFFLLQFAQIYSNKST
jgi:hypothetical protein